MKIIKMPHFREQHVYESLYGINSGDKIKLWHYCISLKPGLIVAPSSHRQDKSFFIFSKESNVINSSINQMSSNIYVN